MAWHNNGNSIVEHILHGECIEDFKYCLDHYYTHMHKTSICQIVALYKVNKPNKMIRLVVNPKVNSAVKKKSFLQICSS